MIIDNLSKFSVLNLVELFTKKILVILIFVLSLYKKEQQSCSEITMSQQEYERNCVRK